MITGVERDRDDSPQRFLRMTPFTRSLLLLDGDTLKDVGQFRKIHLILKDGRVVDRAGLPTIRVLDFDPEAPWQR